MSENQKTIEFTITTSRDQLVDKTIEEIKKHTYLDPLFDAAFKAFLSDEEALVNFLNGVFRLKEGNKIESVVIKNSEINVIFPAVKSFRLDIRATTSNGIHINVEMQKAKPDFFVDRVLLQHCAFMLQSKYEWDRLNFGNFPPDLTKEQRAEREIHRYEVPPTYAIWICDFPISEQKHFRGDWAIRSKEGLTLSDKMMYILYDLTKFNKTFEEIMTAEERWLYLLKHAGKAEKLPDFNDSVIAKAIHRILVNRASEKLIKDQANDMVWTEEELDHLALLEVRAEQKGLEKGLEKGLKQGLKQGLEQGLEQGLKQGLEQGHEQGLEKGRAEGEIKGLEKGRIEMALDMLVDNEPIEKIVKYSHLPESKILELKASSAGDAIK